MRTKVTGDQYMMADGLMSEVKRQIKHPHHRIDVEMLTGALKAFLDGRSLTHRLVWEPLNSDQPTNPSTAHDH